MARRVSGLRTLTFSSILVAMALVAARPAGATVVEAVDFDAQSVAAFTIFVGKVQAVESRPVARAPQYFETLVTFVVEEVVAGGLGSTVALRFAGGEVGDLRQSIDGMPEFAVGERYVVFCDVERTPPAVSPIVGFNQGLYRVVSAEGPRGTHDVVRDRLGRPLGDFAGTPAAAGRRAEGGAAAATDPELADFLDAVRAARQR